MILRGLPLTAVENGVMRSHDLLLAHGAARCQLLQLKERYHRKSKAYQNGRNPVAISSFSSSSLFSFRFNDGESGPDLETRAVPEDGVVRRVNGAGRANFWVGLRDGLEEVVRPTRVEAG